MKIGILGTGNMGRTLGVRWARAGHDVAFGARDRAKAEAAQLAQDAPGARVVQAFNTVPHRIIELDRRRLDALQVSMFLCSDDAAAKAIVARLAEDLGFVGVDSGELRRARIVDGVVDFIRFQIATMGRGPLTTISLGSVSEVAS
jgi:predicted dinucleotide-binding enzyme